MSVKVDTSQAQALHKANDLEAAEVLYRQHIEQAPEVASAHYGLGTLLAQTGRLAASVDHLRKACDLAPDHRLIRKNLAVVLYAAGQPAEAARHFQRLAGEEPESADHWVGLGLTASAQGHLSEAIDFFRHALALRPGDAECCCNLGIAYRAAGRLDDAIGTFGRAITLSPSLVKAHGNLGATLFEGRRWEEAVRAWTRVLDLEPGHADIHSDIDVALASLGREDDAIASFQRAVAIAPDRATYLYNLARALMVKGRLDEAAATYEKTIALEPGHTAAHLNLGVVYKKLKRFGEAVAAYDRALDINPDNAEAHLNRAKALLEGGCLKEALASCRAVTALRPNDAEAWSELVNIRKYLCDWDGLEADEETCRTLVLSGARGADPGVFLMLSRSSVEQLACAKAWVDDHTCGITPRGTTCPPLDDKGRIRVGYLSIDLRNHAVGRLIADLFERHDRERFEIFAYSYGHNDNSALRHRLEAAVDHFIDICPLDDSQAAERIASDSLHILVDLTGHTAGNRIGILARRPAPIQVNYLGYAGTLGTGFMDYILADPVIAPHEDQRGFAERIIHLPNTYLSYDPDQRVSCPTPTREECGLPKEAFVFCAFHAAYKIRADFFAAWMRLLRQVEESVLWLLMPSDAARANLNEAARRQGVNPERLIFAPRADIGLYLARHRLADLFLDVLPYNAHGSAADALWAGLPLLTCTGTTFPGRVATGILRAAGLPELATGSLAEYEKLALELTHDHSRLRDLRRRAENARDHAPLFDNVGFVRHVETAYLSMWSAQHTGQDNA